MNLFKTVSLEKAPLLLRWANIFQVLMFVLPVIVLFYKHKGLTVGDFFLIQGLFSIFYFLLEIPTGYIGDLFSRKTIIVFSFLSYFLGYLVWCLFSGFYFILLGEIFLAIASALYSGTGEAYLYDVLKKQGKEKYIMKELGKIAAYATYGTAFATFTGGVIYKYFGPDNLILLESLFIFAAFIFTLYLPSIPDVKRTVEKGKSKWKDILEICHYASTHREIKWLMLFPAAFGSATLMLMWLQQPLMENNLVPVALFGVFIGLNQLFRAIFSHNSDNMFNKLKTKGFSLSLFAILIISLFAAYIIPSINNLYITYALLILVALAPASQASLGIVTSSMINHRIKSDERATVLSVNSMFNRFFCAIVMISLKFLIDGIGLQTTIAVMSPIVIILTFIAMVKLLKLKI